MIVYKFGGASVSSGAGVRRVCEIVSRCDDKLVIVVSAMGKTTNKLENILEKLIVKDFDAARSLCQELLQFHTDIMEELNLKTIFIEHIYNNIIEFIEDDKFRDRDYEYRYDAFVSFGEILSSTVLSIYLTSQSVANKMLDMRDIIITDSSFREANVDMEATSQRLHRAMQLGFNIYVTQGFIAGDIKGNTTTLGREGSDYSAAIVANVLYTTSLTIWKDVDGVFNADPKEFPDAVCLAQIPYSYAVELAFCGAQVIHPKTIKPLENKGIPLYVKSFSSDVAPGTIINSEDIRITKPFLIKKKDQILITIRPKDLSFISEFLFSDITHIFESFKQSINMAQISAVSISLSTDSTRYFDELVAKLSDKYVIRYNKDLEILTIKNFDADLLAREKEGRSIFLEQRTRTSVKLLRNGN